MNKYGAKKTDIDGISFDSKHEATRWCELKYMERAGLIKNLRRQVRYQIVPAITEKGKVVQRESTYIADFVYEQNGEMVVEDAKSPATRTAVYLLKKKIMRWRYGIEIKEV